ncbi:CopG family ribbon-helix-helix protein [Leucothrix arctica]|uniref:CopG family transcriptional regulator n=1 Tax=Leucothrix arctica TaxID=1481894 RepID=A0A317CR34_9GAMM|nr:CopG family transcriptional regulator [Leucothrix arctica]PWQ98752.1 CopG family transcriptional regulator [Leucothrix arctica]
MTTIKLTDEIINDVKFLADEQGRSPHWVMLEAIKKYVRESKQAIEDEKAWLQSGVDALKNAEEKGYAYTAEEMNDELDQLKNTLQKK